MKMKVKKVSEADFPPASSKKAKGVSTKGKKASASTTTLDMSQIPPLVSIAPRMMQEQHRITLDNFWNVALQMGGIPMANCPSGELDVVYGMYIGQTVSGRIVVRRTEERENPHLLRPIAKEDANNENVDAESNNAITDEEESGDNAD